MKYVKVLGGGCTSCKVTYKLIEDIAREQGATIDLQKVEDMQDIMAYDVMSTPAVVINETVVHRGGVPKRQQIEDWISEA